MRYIVSKRIFVPTVILFLLFTGAAVKESPIDGFAKKAQIAQKDIEVSAAKLEKLKMVFKNTEQNIQVLKAVTKSRGIAGVINNLRLKYYLSSGNRLGYKIYRLEAGIQVLKEDYFTYVSLINEEYGSQIKDCYEKKCAGMKALYDKRREWSNAADKYGDVLKIDLSSMKLINNYSSAAAKDVKDYLQKKIVQAEQRIYMLEEEKEIIEIMKKSGFTEAYDEKLKNAGKRAELKKLKKELQAEMNKIK